MSNEAFNIPEVTYEFVYNYLNGLDITKATGTDEISAYILKKSAPIIAESLPHIINLSIRNSVFPSSWKVAKVIPIYKSGSSMEVSNYRPISVLPVVSKIIEKHVHQTLYEYFQKFQLLRVAQSGFRANHSCETALLKLIEEWYMNIDDGNMIGTIFLDLRKAYDLAYCVPLFSCSSIFVHQVHISLSLPTA